MKKFYSLTWTATLLVGIGLIASPAIAEDHHYSRSSTYRSSDSGSSSSGSTYSSGDSGSTTGSSGSSGSTTNSQYIVVATNDLGMHCACPGAQYFLLLPPFNTLRAQVIRRGSEPQVITDPSQIRVEYNIVENTDASLAADPYFQSWMANAPILFPGYDPAPGGVITGLAGKTLHDTMDAKPEGWWEAVGIPAFPDVSDNSTPQEKLMTDPLGGPNRNPYLTGNVKVFDQASGNLLAETNTTVPVAFGGCCSCHLQLTQDHGMAPTPENSFALMGQLHERDSGINIATIDPDNDGVGGPIRCSQCHLDPAMGETTPPGYDGYPTSQYTFSDVLHRWHVQNPNVLSYDPDLANNCYACHPGNGVNCYRGHHTNKTIGSPSHNVWCSDCHGDLNQRVAEGQMQQPWSDQTLPTCSKCHDSVGEGGGYLNMGIFGQYLNSRGHEDHKILCSTCHGEPHALYPSTLAKDNEQMVSLQGTPDALGAGSCNACHTDRPNGGTPHH